MTTFSSPALNHRLIQIAMDGSQKLSQRWLETLAIPQEHGVKCPAILTGVAGWLRHIRGDNREVWGAVDDPLAGVFSEAWSGMEFDDLITALFGESGLVSSTWIPDQEDRRSLRNALRDTP